MLEGWTEPAYFGERQMLDHSVGDFFISYRKERGGRPSCPMLQK